MKLGFWDISRTSETQTQEDSKGELNSKQAWYKWTVVTAGEPHQCSWHCPPAACRVLFVYLFLSVT